MTRQTATPDVASARPRRTPLQTRNRLAVRNKKDGYVYRIVNDDEDNIQYRIEQGYEIVPAEEIGRVGDKRVDSASAPGSSSYLSVGQGMKAVVMRIRKDWYDEDQNMKQQLVDATEETMNKTPKADYGSVRKSIKYSEDEA